MLVRGGSLEVAFIFAFRLVAITSFFSLWNGFLSIEDEEGM